MNKLVIAATALTLAISGTAAIAQQAMTENDVRTHLQHDGYQHVHDLKFTDGMWRAKAEGGDGTNVTIKVDPKTGKAFPDKEVAKMSEQDIKASLSSQGYTDIHDVDFDDGVWHAKARNASGKKVKLQLDPDTGKVVGTD